MTSNPSQHNSKLNSKPYHYKLNFILTSKQKYNSEFQEFEELLKYIKRPNLDQKNFLGSTIMRNRQKKEGKKEGNLQKTFLLFLSFVLFRLYYTQPSKWNNTPKNIVLRNLNKIESFIKFDIQSKSTQLLLQTTLLHTQIHLNVQTKV